ncbi:resuscitation-promoting factor rpfE [Mycobacterium lepraemurium]|nr:resuscitation-promoting factor rpfE [Mycobacterium lepraemurium]
MRNVRKTLILAAITGTLVTIPSATAHADSEQVGFDPSVPAAGPGSGRPAAAGPGCAAGPGPGRPAASRSQGVQRELGRHRAARVGRQLGGITTANGYAGGLQFTSSTWHANGGSGSPAGASREEQIRVTENVLHSQGIGAWPVCGRRG